MRTFPFHSGKINTLSLLSLLCCCILPGTLQAANPETLAFGKFGKITLYHPPGVPNSLALFVSGDGGWKNSVIAMAESLAAQGALVAGIDARFLRAGLEKQKSDCYYPAGDFEQLSMMLQKKYHFQDYEKPVLVGYSYGATLVYGILAQAPSGTFKGVLALGFSADIDLKKPLCKGSGLNYHIIKPGKTYYLEPQEKLPAPFIILHGDKDQVCPYQPAADFLREIPGSELVTLPGVGHGFSGTARWLPQFTAAYKKILDSGHKAIMATGLKTELPIIVTEPKGKPSGRLDFLISGDGGWTSFDQGIADALAAKGAMVLGLDAQKYFWNARTPAGTTEEIAKVLRYYLARQTENSFTIMGYSFGACITPFIVSRLPEDLKPGLKGFVLLSPDVQGDFEIHIADMLSFGGKSEPYDVLKELEKTAGLRSVCIFGTGEDQKIVGQFRKAGAKVELLPGDHHFNNSYEDIAKIILSF